MYDYDIAFLTPPPPEKKNTSDQFRNFTKVKINLMLHVGQITLNNTS